MRTHQSSNLLHLPVILFGVLGLVFLILQIVPPGEHAALLSRSSPHNIPFLIRHYGLDRPMHEQFWNWLTGYRDWESHQWTGGILRGDLGFSRVGTRPVTALLAERFPATVELAFWSMVPLFFGGVWYVLRGTAHADIRLEKGIRALYKVGRAYPVIGFILLLIMVFSIENGWLSQGRHDPWVAEVLQNPNQWTNYTGLLSIDALLNGRLDVFWSALCHLLPPMITLMVIQCAMLFQPSCIYRRDNSSNIFRCGSTKRPKYSGSFAVLGIVSVGFLMNLLNSTIIAETIFDFPGIGQAVAFTAATLDIVALTGMLLLFGIIHAVVNLLMDSIVIVPHIPGHQSEPFSCP